jgi:hypothetical protein
MEPLRVLEHRQTSLVLLNIPYRREFTIFDGFYSRVEVLAFV